MLKPLHQNVVLEVVEVQTATASGIILSGTAAKPAHTEGIVKAVGSGRLLADGTRVSLSVNENDRVVFNDYAGKKVSHEGKEYMIVSEDDILAIIE